MMLFLPVPANLDILQFGVPASEKAHRLTAESSEVVQGGLATPARRLLPHTPQTWEGGRLGFDMKVDPQKPNYVTVRLWGSDTQANRLVLFVDGKQIGYHHIGDYDLIDFGSESGQPSFNGRFFISTTPIPASLTKGKSSLHLEVRSMGALWSYGQTFDKFQKLLSEPTRGIYAAYTHTDGFFRPPPGERQGQAVDPPIRENPKAELLETLKARLNKTIDNLITKGSPLNQMEAHTLARAYRMNWTHAYRNPEALKRVVEAGDNLFRRFNADPRLVSNERDTWNPDWFGFGPFGQVVGWLSGEMKLDENMSDGNGDHIPRRSAYIALFKASVNYLRTHRRWYTNQSMIVDLYAYLSNQGLRAVAPEQAFPEEKMLDFLHQSLGIKPWLGSDTPDGTPDYMLGKSYFQITKKGLTRELGYVGYYGEVLDWAASIYQATKGNGAEGDPLIKAQLVKLANARSYFRYPSVDADGNRTMRIEAVVGWRDAHYPGDVVYGERFAWDGSPLYVAAATKDPRQVSFAQQMFADNQFYSSVEEHMKMGGLRVDAGMLDIPDEVTFIEKSSPGADRLPMSQKGDWVWSDEEDGVVAIHHGNDVLYASLYWRARAGVNFLAKVHLIRPTMDRLATVNEEIRFEPSGLFYTRPDNINSLAQGTRNFQEYADIHSAHAGERLPIAKVPAGTNYKPGDESVYAGRGRFYVLRYGPYLIAMNMGAKSDSVIVPASSAPIPELVSRKSIPAKGGLQTVAPGTTAVFYFAKDDR
jgi:hypothetical protein